MALSRREQLDEILSAMVGVEEAYFQADQNIKLKYPCIVYERSNSFAARADNIPYWLKKRYAIVVIDRDPDSLIPDQVEGLPYSRFDRAYVVDGLNHFAFELYF